TETEAIATLEQQYPGAASGNPLTDTSAAPGKGQQAATGAPLSVQAISRAAADALAQLGIRAPGSVGGAQNIDANALLSALHGDGQGSEVPSGSLYPSWWPTVASPLSADGSQVQNGACLAGYDYRPGPIPFVSPAPSNSSKTPSPGTMKDYLDQGAN